MEDNDGLAEGLVSNFEIEGYAVSRAADGASGLELLRRDPPDLVVLDLLLPGLDGYRVLKALREEGFEMPVLVLTARGEEADKVRGFRLGADDYVTKPFGLLELLARVSALLRRAKPRDKEPAASETRFGGRFGDVVVDAVRRRVTKAGRDVDLTPKEWDLLVALLEARGAVVSRLALLSRVWGYDAAVVSRTVDTHVAELRRKLEDDPAVPRHILTARTIGYRLSRD